MPGGQFTNLKAQARSLGLEERWHEVAETYAEVNRMFGDIVKVTPSSKVVGDMALMMVSQGLSRADVENPDREVAFPESVVDMMKGNLGQPPGGWPEAAPEEDPQGREAHHRPPGPSCEAARYRGDPEGAVEGVRRPRVDDEDLNGYLMYPKVYADYLRRNLVYGPGAHAAHEDLLLRDGAGRRNLGRDRPGQDAGDPASGGGRNARGRVGAGVLRTERPAPRDPGGRPQGGGARPRSVPRPRRAIPTTSERRCRASWPGRRGGGAEGEGRATFS
jgi:hypothetical protein